MAGVLKLDPEADSEEVVLRFELDYLATLTTAERFALMRARSELLAKELIRRGHREPVALSKRT
jgi:hypothetical protein